MKRGGKEGKWELGKRSRLDNERRAAVDHNSASSSQITVPLLPSEQQP